MTNPGGTYTTLEGVTGALMFNDLQVMGGRSTCAMCMVQVGKVLGGETVVE